MDLEGRFQHVMIRTANADGTTAHACATHAGERVSLPAARPTAHVAPPPPGAGRVVLPTRAVPHTRAAEER
jgi:hypothetical protein